ncbi:MAG TPA: T9SS type A sorting domain-containing protein [Bacteroidia bacterium]|nr:T9SS type A sorting domain-containing protein [Bacteroidia bacterium]
MKSKILLPLFISISFFGNAQVSPATNYISLDVSTSPQNAGFDYDSCFTIGDDIGMSSVGMFQNWTNIETAPGVFDLFLFDIANFYYPANGMPVDLTIAPIATNQLEVPSDLTSTTFDSPVMINRFKILLDSIDAHIPSLTLSSLVIGSEHDIYIGGNTTLWNQYTIFYDSVSAYAKMLWPGLKVATELTFTGITNYNSFAQTLNTNSDYIGVSHYPLNNDFTVKPVSILAGDFDTLVTLYPSKPICFYQYGYPSSTSCNSSEALQSQFITETFNVWDTYSSNVRMIDFTWLHDLDTATVNYYATYYGITDTVFLEFLRTLGFRDWNGNGSDKPALDELRCQAKMHGFNSLPIVCNVGVDETLLEENSFSFYPNPANQTLSVTVNDNKQNGFIQIYSSMGVLIKEFDVIQSIQIDITDLDCGFYFICLKNDHVRAEKFIKE